MLWQLHHQEKGMSGRSDMIAQKSFPEGDISKDFKIWFDDVAGRHPLTENKTWMFCNEKSEQFVWATPNPTEGET